MSDKYQGKETGLDSPGVDHFEVTPDDDADLQFTTRGIFVGNGGDLELILANTKGSTGIVYENVPDGTLLPLRVRRVKAAATTATGIVGIL